MHWNKRGYLKLTMIAKHELINNTILTMRNTSGKSCEGNLAGILNGKQENVTGKDFHLQRRTLREGTFSNTSLKLIRKHCPPVLYSVPSAFFSSFWSDPGSIALESQCRYLVCFYYMPHAGVLQ